MSHNSYNLKVNTVHTHEFSNGVFGAEQLIREVSAYGQYFFLTVDIAFVEQSAFYEQGSLYLEKVRLYAGSHHAFMSSVVCSVGACHADTGGVLHIRGYAAYVCNVCFVHSHGHSFVEPFVGQCGASREYNAHVCVGAVEVAHKHAFETSGAAPQHGEHGCAPENAECGEESAGFVSGKCGADFAPVFYVKYRIFHRR